jgi:uncharacterized protein (DUF1810 family)
MSARVDDLARFVQAQAAVFDTVRAELQAGAKSTHWMWYVFPQLRGLGRSRTAQTYGIESAAQARAYWRHPVLGPRLKACVEWVLALPSDRSARDIFGSPDDLKFWSCLTLFQRVAPEEPVFDAALARFYGGRADEGTLGLLADLPGADADHRCAWNDGPQRERSS